MLFKIVEYDDIYSEHPSIYAKVLSNAIILIDSGCGGQSNGTTVDIKSLRGFIGTCPIDANANRPLNEDETRKYIVVCTHCHYDHILSLEQFVKDSQILASSHDPSFLTPENLPKSTQCQRLKISDQNIHRYWWIVEHTSLSRLCRLACKYFIHQVILRINSHFGMAAERLLYAGDTVYEWEPILFPPEGDIIKWFTTMDYLIDSVQDTNRSDPHNRVKINAGHDTSVVDALNVLQEGKSFLADVISGKERVKERTTKDGIRLVFCAKEDGRFSLRCPEKLVLDAREHTEAC